MVDKISFFKKGEIMKILHLTEELEQLLTQVCDSALKHMGMTHFHSVKKIADSIKTLETQEDDKPAAT